MNRVITFGDSVMRGVVNINGEYHACRNSFVHLCEKSFEIDVTNRAKFGSTIVEGEAILERALERIDEFTERFVFLEFGGNDCDFDWKAISDLSSGKVDSKTPISIFRNYYYAMIDMIRRVGKEPVILSLPPIDSTKYYQWITRNLDSNNILSFLEGDIKFLENWHERYNLEVFQIARNKNAKIIDITSPILEKKNYSNYLCIDGIHPNEEGHILIADAIYREMKSIPFLS